MFEENEVVMLLIGFGVFLFGLLQRQQLRHLTRASLLATSYCFLLLAWISTVAEGFVFPVALNLLEHLSYALSACLLCIWTFALLMEKPGGAGR